VVRDAQNAGDGRVRSIGVALAATDPEGEAAVISVGDLLGARPLAVIGVLALLQVEGVQDVGANGESAEAPRVRDAVVCRDGHAVGQARPLDLRGVDRPADHAADHRAGLRRSEERADYEANRAAPLLAAQSCASQRCTSLIRASHCSSIRVSQTFRGPPDHVWITDNPPVQWSATMPTWRITEGNAISTTSPARISSLWIGRPKVSRT